jgi:hypothetical protein
MKPSITSLVLLVLTAEMAAQINRRRTTGQSISERLGVRHWPAGAQAHIGNTANEGDIVPVLVVRVSGDAEDALINGQAFLDGTDTLWVTSLPFAAELTPGSWSWPEITAAAPASITAAMDTVVATASTGKSGQPLDTTAFAEAVTNGLAEAGIHGTAEVTADTTGHTVMFERSDGVKAGLQAEVQNDLHDLGHWVSSSVTKLTEWLAHHDASDANLSSSAPAAV